MRYFLAKSPILELFEDLTDFQATLNGASKPYTFESCKDLTFAEVSESNHLLVEYKIQDKFKNASLLNFVNIFGEKVVKKGGEEELSSIFLRETDKEVKTIYVDEMK